MSTSSASGVLTHNRSQLHSQSTSQITVSQRWSLALIFILWLVIYVGGMFNPPLLDDADSKHAEVSREMVLRHDYVTLYANGIRYMEKAPFPYWCVATSYRIFGVHDWSTRLPVVLWMLALFYAIYWGGKRYFGERGGLYSALVLTTSIGPYLYTRFLIPDTLVGLWLLLTFVFFLRTLEEDPPSRFDCWGLAVVSGLNVLTKGLIGLVFPAATIGLFLIITGNLKHLLKLRLFSSTLMFLAVAAPWHILAAVRNPDQGSVRGFLWFYFINEHVMRFLNKRVPRDYDTVPLLLFWVLTVVWLVPWAAFLPQAIREVPLRWGQWRAGLDRQQRANLLFLIWAGVILLFFSFSTRQEYYTIPALPGMALLVGGWLAREEESASDSRERRAGRISATVMLVLGALAFVFGMAVLLSSRPPAAGVDLADLLRKHPQDYALSLGHFLDLTPEALGVFRGPMLGTSVALLAGTALNWYWRRRNRTGLGNAALVGMMVVVLFCVHSAYVTFNPILSSRNLAAAIERHYRPGDVLVTTGEYEAASTLNYYTGHHLLVLHPPSASMWYGSRFPDAPPVFETAESFADLWNGGARVFLWSDRENPAVLQGKPSFQLAYSGGKYIYTNRAITGEKK
jgi:4-amino-4-deoxy-L-arabinose transferase-like glycosyltransferase